MIYRSLQRLRKAARLVMRAARVARADGPVAAVTRSFRYVAARSGLVSQLEVELAIARLLAQCQGECSVELDPLRSAVLEQQFRMNDLYARMNQQPTLLGQLQSQVDELHHQGALISQSLLWLGEHHHTVSDRAHPPPVGSDDSGPLVSVVMPTWNRRTLVGAAIDSVQNQSYPNWELLIVDDGSTDGTADLVESRPHDPRVRLFRREHHGVSAARNWALQQARGEFVAYLDSDNVWFPQYLAEVVSAFSRQPEGDCAYAAQIVDDGGGATSFLRCPRFDGETYRETSGIDLNVFVHRRRLIEQFGGFDEQMTRLVDWDLIVRCTRHQDPVRVPTIGGRYRASGDDRITSTASYTRNRYLLRRKHEPRIDRNLRVLYIVWDYPQLTETYVRWEIACMRRWGVHVEVWSEVEKTAAPYASEVPVHHGSLEEAIRRVKPHLAHVHWLNIAGRYHERIARAGLQMTVRGHGFEFDASAFPQLLGNAAVQAVYVFPHYAPAVARDSRIRPMNVAFNGELYYPQPDKDPFLVVRTASGKPAKAVETFIDVAALCPQHRFILVLGVLNQLETYVDALVEYNRRCGSPVDIRINLPTEQSAALVRKAGVYLHTYGDQEPFGMPISIAEAMATGAYTLVRRLPGAAAYVGDAGALYGSAEEAAHLIRQSARWYREQWQDRQARAVEFAYQNYADLHVLKPLLLEWQRTTDAGIPAPSIIDDLFDPALRPALSFLLDETRLGLISNFGRSYLSHVVGAYRQLRDWNADADVSRAGLFHSIYIDSRVEPDLLHRERVRQVIGERSERLAYAFCATSFAYIEQVLHGSAAIELPDRLANGTLRLSRTDFDDLCLIHLAEWTEKAPRCPEAQLNPAFYRRIAEYLARSGRIPGEHPRTTCVRASHPLRRAA